MVISSGEFLDFPWSLAWRLGRGLERILRLLELEMNVGHLREKNL